MTRPYSEDLRERVVRVVESGTSRNAAAKQFDVSISFVVKLMQRWKQRGTIKADKYGGWKKSKLAPHGDRIRALVMENCDITIDELRVLLAAEGIEAKRSTLGDFLLAQGVNGGAKLVHPGGAKLVHLTLCGTRCWGVVPVVHRRDPRCFE